MSLLVRELYAILVEQLNLNVQQLAMLQSQLLIKYQSENDPKMQLQQKLERALGNFAPEFKFEAVPFDKFFESCPLVQEYGR